MGNAERGRTRTDLLPLAKLGMRLAPSYPYDFKHDWDNCIEFKVKKWEAGE